MWIYLEWYEKPWETIGFGARIIYGYHPYGKPNVNRPFGDGVLTHFRELMLCGGHFFTTLAFFPVLKLTRAKSFGWISYSTRQFHCAHGIPDSALPRPLPRMVCEGSQRLFLQHVGFICRCCGGGFGETAPSMYRTVLGIFKHVYKTYQTNIAAKKETSA